MKRLVFDLDGTLTTEGPQDYTQKKPNVAVIQRLREYKAAGFEIVICTARNMRTYGGSIGHLNVHTLPTVIEWLNSNDVPYDEVHVGKPWCGNEGFYIDDKAIRPSEFLRLGYAEVLEVLSEE